ncbi:MAG TPA: heme ABC exporter ATP-binding protein CcmA [Vicinamibacterales bacterium]|nr:heme ABC exporter ATP-binding protein CcmA [Vicinamibacterales bacterium]
MTIEFDRLILHDVTRVFERRRALSHVSLTCEAGEIFGLLGPNGAGKSTLLSIVATLLTPSAGTVRYGEHTVQQAGPELRARIGLLGHDLYLYPELSARENLTFFAHLYDMRDVAGCVARALERANLTERADDPVFGYSRGMRQRLALERALLHDPRLLLLDEPFTGLDDASTHALLERLREFRAAGRIVVLATHDLDVADGIVDRVGILRNGRMLDAGGSASDPLRARYRAALLAAAPAASEAGGRAS